MLKTLKNLLPRNQKADDLESWYAPSASSTIEFIQMMTLSWPWPILRQGQIWSLMLLYWENGETVDFSVTVVVCDIKLVDAVK